MSLTRWDPFYENLPLRDTMDRFFLDSFFRPVTRNGESALPLDVIERENEFVVRASIPGYDPNDVDISVQGNVLTLRGTMRQEQENGHGNYYLRERRMGSFERSVQLPTGVNADQANAEYKHGILTLHLPKAESAIAKKIKVNS